MNLFETGDITKNRHRNAPASVAANARVNKDTDNAKVMEIMRKKYRSHSKEIAGLMGKNLNEISGRLSFLKKNGYIKERHDLMRIEGCTVLEWTGK